MVAVAVAPAIAQVAVPDLARLRAPLQAVEVQEAIAVELAWLDKAIAGGVTPGPVCQMAWLQAVEAVEPAGALLVALAVPELSTQSPGPILANLAAESTMSLAAVQAVPTAPQVLYRAA